MKKHIFMHGEFKTLCGMYVKSFVRAERPLSLVVDVQDVTCGKCKELFERELVKAVVENLEDDTTVFIKGWDPREEYTGRFFVDYYGEIWA